jgi:hypothetical protein
MPRSSTTYKEGHKSKGGPGSNGQIRRDLTMELIQQLNEVVKDKDGIERPKLHRVIKNLITQATTAADEYDEDGNLVKEGAGDLAAIREIFDRLEGKPRQQITGPDNGPVEVEFRTIEEVRAYLLERGIDWLRLPPPSLRIVDDSKD